MPGFYKERHINFETFKTKSIQSTPDHAPKSEKGFSQQFWK